MNNQLITIIYNNINYWHIDGKRTFFHWLKKLKSVKNYKEINPREVHVYIDLQNIQDRDPISFYRDVLDLSKMFDLYRAKGREQLEQLAPYLSKEYAKYFNKYFIQPLKRKKLKNKNIKLL